MKVAFCKHISRSLLFLSFVVCFTYSAEAHTATDHSSCPMHPCVVGTTVFFSADNGVCGRELWQCDSRGACSLVADLNAGHDGSDPTILTAVGTAYLFFQATVSGKPSLFLLNTKTQSVTNITERIDESGNKRFVSSRSLDSILYLLITADNAHFELWAVGPDSLSCNKVYTLSFTDRIEPTQITYCLHRLGNRLACINNNTLLLFNTAGVMEHTFSFPDGFSPFRIMGCPVNSSEIVLLAKQDSYGIEPFRLQLQPEEFSLVRDIFKGPTSSGVDQDITFKKNIFFGADDGIHGSELWCTNGTPNGTVMVADIFPGKRSSSPYKLCPVGDLLYFVADDGTHGAEVWKTDGTATGTQITCDLTPGPEGTDLWSLASFKGYLFFCANTSEYGEEIYITGNDIVNPRIFKDIVPGTKSSGPHNILPLGDTFFFTCDDGIHGEEPWISDGTASGTHLAKDIAAPRQVLSSNPEQLTAWGDTLYFSAAENQHGREPWVSNGSEEGTVLAQDIYPGNAGSDPQHYTVCGEEIFFSASTQEYGRELCSLKGKDNPTLEVYDINPGQKSSMPDHLTSLRSTLYFAADDNTHGVELWRLKRGNEQPELVLDFTDGETGTSIKDIFVLWDTLFLYVEEKTNLIVLYRLNDKRGDEPVFQAIKEPNTDLYTLLTDRRNNEPLPSQMNTLAYFIHPPKMGTPSYIALPDENKTVLFATHTPVSGVEPWKSDGSFVGTTMVDDIYPGPPSSGPDQFSLLGERVYFIAEAPGEGRILFFNDNREETTAPVTITEETFFWPPIKTNAIAACNTGLIALGVLPPRRGIAGPSLMFIRNLGATHQNGLLMKLPENPTLWPYNLTSTGKQVFFVFEADNKGKELWVTDTTPDGTRMVKNIFN